MIISFRIDNKTYYGNVSKYEWLMCLLSVAIHPNNNLKWRYMKIKDIRGLGQYDGREWMHIPLCDIILPRYTDIMYP